jgi:hypothetical protein
LRAGHQKKRGNATRVAVGADPEGIAVGVLGDVQAAEAATVATVDGGVGALGGETRITANCRQLTEERAKARSFS